MHISSCDLPKLEQNGRMFHQQFLWIMQSITKIDRTTIVNVMGLTVFFAIQLII